MCQLYPFITESEGITTHPFGQLVKFKFLRSPEPREINSLQYLSISKTLNLIRAKTQHLMHLKDGLRYKKVKEQLTCKNIQVEIKKFEENLKQEVYSDLPTTFWHRKRHKVALLYVKDFLEKDIPTKARPIQMSQELMDFQKVEIKDLLKKGIIKKSRSPWSCPAFYVQKNVEIERGVPRLVNNYKPLNKVLEWVRYLIPNKKDLVNRFRAQSPELSLFVTYPSPLLLVLKPSWPIIVCKLHFIFNQRLVGYTAIFSTLAYH